jgi:tRNA-2-methylthio-N6-dimethylallyladenosine synthase
MAPAVLERIAEYDSLATQIHLPMQSADDKVLIRMNRNHRLDQYRAVVDNIRTMLPAATLFTDIIVGFCGETEEQFERTRRAMEEFAFDMAYIAMYSPRPGAAAARWPDDVPRADKKRRLQVLSDVLQDTALRHNRRWEGRTLEVLVEAEDRKPGLLIGRTEGRVPVRFPGGADLIGSHVSIDVTRSPPPETILFAPCIPLYGPRRASRCEAAGCTWPIRATGS